MGVLAREDPPFPSLLGHYQQKPIALVPFQRLAIPIGVPLPYVDDGKVRPDEADFLDGHAHITFPEGPGEECSMNPDEFFMARDPLAEHVDEVAVVDKVLIHGDCVVLVPPGLPRGNQYSDGRVVVGLFLSLR